MSENERMRSIWGGHCGVVTKIVREVDELLRTDDLRTATQLHIKLQQLEAKLKVLSDIDKNILSKCDVGEIEHEIEESEAITAKIGQFHVSENILITFLIAVTSRLDAVDARKNVLQPMRIRRSTVIKRLSRMNYMV